LFSIRTPTALVEDLGTEFGVEVSDSGETASHVFLGKVRVKVEGAGNVGRGMGDENDKSEIRNQKSEIVLSAGQSARVEKDNTSGSLKLTADEQAAASAQDKFVRRLERAPRNVVRVVEKFDGGKLGEHFEIMPPGRYAILFGVAEYMQSLTEPGRENRAYIRTKASDFIDRDFVFEATVRVEYDGPILPANANTGHRIFFGLGDGVPNEHYYDLVRCGVVMDYTVDTGRAFVRYCHPESDLRISSQERGREVAEMAAPGSLRPGRHCLRMEKTGPWISFSLDADYDGVFNPDYVGRKIHILSAGPQLLDRANSRLLVGTGNCDKMKVRIEELSVEYANNESANKK
jgi:hypothetical protein